jgi:hypothetical protein
MRRELQTFFTSLLTESERDSGWWRCELVGCPGGGPAQLPHIHRERTKAKAERRRSFGRVGR